MQLTICELFFSQVLTKGFNLRIINALLLESINCICGSAGIGRQARLRGVCCMTYGFKSHLPHHSKNRAITQIARFFFILLDFFVQLFSSYSCDFRLFPNLFRPDFDQDFDQDFSKILLLKQKKCRSLSLRHFLYLPIIAMRRLIFSICSSTWSQNARPCNPAYDS